MALRSRIVGVGANLPSRVVTNDDLAKLMETSDEWIVQRTGIRERRWVEKPGTGSAELGELAARNALENAGLKPEDLDAIIFATLSPDHYFPGSGCVMQARLGI